jgi:hypothetical protein
VAALDRLSVVLVFLLAVVILGEAFSLKAALGAVRGRGRDPAHLASDLAPSAGMGHEAGQSR